MIIHYKMRHNRAGHKWIDFTGEFIDEAHWRSFYRRESIDRNNIVMRHK